MTDRIASILTFAAALGGSLLLSGAAQAQTEPPSAKPAAPTSDAQIRARAATSLLNGGTAETTLTPRLNAQPPLTDAERPTPVRPLYRPAAAPEPVAPVEQQVEQQVEARQQTRPQTGSKARPPVSIPDPDALPAATATADQTPARPGPPSITLAPGQSEPDPISMPLGYYVRGDKGCNEIWPGEGNLAWFTPTAFTIDFGGCEPNDFLQTGPNAWTEEQRCMTELGGDAGRYTVTYEALEPGLLLRRAEMDLDGSVEEDQWRHCEASEIPEEARFKS